MSSIHRDFKKFLLCFRDMCWIGNMGHVAGGWWLHSVEVFPLVYLTSSSRTLISYRYHQVFFGLFLDIGYEEDIPKSRLHQRWAHLFQALELWDLIGLIRFVGLISGFRYEKDTPRSVLHRRWVYHFVALEFWNFRRFHQVFGIFYGTLTLPRWFMVSFSILGSTTGTMGSSEF